MLRHLVIICSLLLVLTVSAIAADKTNPAVSPIELPTIKQLRPGTGLATADTCSALNADTIVWRIDAWVVGDELYEVYIDPENSCDLPYPFSITEIHMLLGFQAATPLEYSVNISEVDWSDPSCPRVGPLTYISQSFVDQVPAPDLYDIWIELDTPIVVDGPFFAGFYIGPGLDAAAEPYIVTDQDSVVCNSYNLWDENVGWVDLMNNEFWNFPGRIWLYAVGTPGGNPGQGNDPEPEVSFVGPEEGDLLFGSADFWAMESSGSTIIDYVSFEYSTGLPFVEFGRDFDGRMAKRDGGSVNPADAFSWNWDFSAMPEDDYMIRATAVDTLGRFASDTINVTLEPTPPIATIVSPDNADAICGDQSILMNSTDANLSLVAVQYKQAESTFSLGLDQLSTDPFGGTFATAPVAAAIMTKVWNDRGFPILMQDGPTPETSFGLAQKLAVEFDTDVDAGSYDDKILKGLRSFFASRGDIAEFDFMRNPDYFDIREWVEGDEKSVMIGLSGATAGWLTVDGFDGWTQLDDTYRVSFSDPQTGTLVTLQLRHHLGSTQILYNATWHTIDIMISMNVKSWVPTWSSVGADFNSTDGWAVNWTSPPLVEDGLYFLRSSGTDATGYIGTSTIMVQYQCAGVYVPGDYNGDSVADINDLILLITFIVEQGPAPLGGPIRSDANGDRFSNVADIVFYMNFLFSGAESPAY